MSASWPGKHKMLNLVGADVLYLKHLDFRAFLEVSIHRFRLLPRWLFVEIYPWSLQLTTLSEWRDRHCVCPSQCPEDMCRIHWIHPRRRVWLCLDTEQKCWRAETKNGKYINKSTRIIQWLSESRICKKSKVCSLIYFKNYWNTTYIYQFIKDLSR